MHEARIDISEIPDRPAQSCLIRRSDREPQNVTNGPLPTPYVCRHGAFPFVQLVKKLLSHFQPPKTTKLRVVWALLLVYVLSFGSVPLSVTNRGHVAALINQSLARLNRGGARSVAVVFVVAVNGVARAT